MPPLLAIEDSPKIERHEKYQAGNAPDFELSDHIVFVLTGQENRPESFLRNFKECYKAKYNGKKLVFLHTCGGHWTTYECDYNYDPNSEPVITRHEITGDGRCGLHAVAKALAIVTEKNDLVETKVLHSITHFQVPDAIGARDDEIFDHLGLDKGRLSDVWIGRVEIEDPNNLEGPRVVKSKGERLTDRISQLQSQSSPEDWLSNEDIENILLKTSIRSRSGKMICLASQNEPFNILPGGKEKGWDVEILSIIYDDKYWQDDKCTKSFESFPAEKGEYFTIFLSSSLTRNNALKHQLDKFKGFKYFENDGGIIEITSDINEFNHIDTLQEKEKFCQFVFDNIGSSWLDDEAKKSIHQTLMFLKIKNMVSGDSFHDKHIYSPNFSAEDRIAKNHLYDELLKFYPLTGSTKEKIDESAKTLIKGFLRQAFTDGIEIESYRKIKISDDTKISFEDAKEDPDTTIKINSLDISDLDNEKLKSIRFLKFTSDKDKTKVLKVEMQDSEIEFKKIKFGPTSPEVVLYSEYVRYAEENKETYTESDFFALQPKKYQGYGLKIRLDNNKLYFEECFNDDYGGILVVKENKEITKINGETLQTHLVRAKLLDIEPEHYISSLVRSSDDKIKLGFEGGEEVELDSKKVFEKSDENGYKVKESIAIDVKEKKEKMDRKMIGNDKKGVGVDDDKKPDVDYKGLLEEITDKNKKTQFVAVIEHIDKRFKLLKEIIKKRKPKVIIFAKDKNKSENHSLGTGYAVSQWSDPKISDFVNEHIEKKIKELEESSNCEKETYEVLKLKNLQDLPVDKTIICRGPIFWEKAAQGGDWVDHDFTDAFPPGDKVIHVWGANVDNFNLGDRVKITGGGQAEGIGLAKFGKFGIVTTNSSLTQSNLDKLRDKDLIYEATAIASTVKDREVPSPSPSKVGLGVATDLAR